MGVIVLGVIWERLVGVRLHGPISYAEVVFGIFARQTLFYVACIHLEDWFELFGLVLDES